MDPTERHYKHATRLSVELYNKYLKGAAEHSGYLPEMSIEQLLDNAIEETIDQFVYLMTLKEKLKEPLDDRIKANSSSEPTKNT